VTSGAQDVKQTGNTLLALGRDLKVAWRLWRDGAVPWWTKTIPLLAWAICSSHGPVDDRCLDWAVGDLAILLLGLRLFISACPAERVQWYRAGKAAPAVAPQAATIDGTYHVAVDPWDEPSRG
jgi:hypothetical protein